MAELGDIQVVLACPGCQWSGTVTLYDIGDGPEWCCPGCDMCFPSNPVVDEEGLTGAEKNMMAAVMEVQARKLLDG